MNSHPIITYKNNKSNIYININLTSVTAFSVVHLHYEVHLRSFSTLHVILSDCIYVTWLFHIQIYSASVATNWSSSGNIHVLIFVSAHIK